MIDDVGVMGLHRLSGGNGKRGGVSCKSIRRQLCRLEELGLVRVVRPPVQFELRAGRLHKAKGHGREKPIRIFITVDQDRHCRPLSKRQVLGRAIRRAAADSYGAVGTTPGDVLMGRHAPPSRERKIHKDNETPADTVGVGAADASTDAGLTAGQAGRQEPAEAGGLAAAVHEEGQAVAEPFLPPPRSRHERPSAPVRPPRQKAAKAPITLASLGVDPAAEERERQAAARKAEEARRRTAEYVAAKAAKRAAAAARQDEAVHEPSPPADAADANLDDLVNGRRREAAAATKAAWRHRWRDERGLPNETMPPPAVRPLDPDAVMLAELVERRRRECAGQAASDHAVRPPNKP